jgi:hypothetical protein
VVGNVFVDVLNGAVDGVDVGTGVGEAESGTVLVTKPPEF